METGNWKIEPETEEKEQNAVWGSINNENGTIHAAIVFNAGTDEARKILSSGMFYLKCPQLSERTLFRIESCRRARIAGCMFVRAVEAANTLRSRENFILREMHRILDMEVLQRSAPEMFMDIVHGEAS